MCMSSAPFRTTPITFLAGREFTAFFTRSFGVAPALTTSTSPSTNRERMFMSTSGSMGGESTMTKSKWDFTLSSTLLMPCESRRTEEFLALALAGRKNRFVSSNLFMADLRSASPFITSMSPLSLPMLRWLDDIEGFLKSFSMTSTFLLNSAAIIQARFIDVVVLPSPLIALVTAMVLNERLRLICSSLVYNIRYLSVTIWSSVSITARRAFRLILSRRTPVSLYSSKTFLDVFLVTFQLPGGGEATVLPTNSS